MSEGALQRCSVVNQSASGAASFGAPASVPSAVPPSGAVFVLIRDAFASTSSAASSTASFSIHQRSSSSWCEVILTSSEGQPITLDEAIGRAKNLASSHAGSGCIEVNVVQDTTGNEAIVVRARDSWRTHQVLRRPLSSPAAVAGTIVLLFDNAMQDVVSKEIIQFR